VEVRVLAGERDRDVCVCVFGRVCVKERDREWGVHVEVRVLAGEGDGDERGAGGDVRRRAVAVHICGPHPFLMSEVPL